jgi:probable F420-dependent oxidoreductase
MQFDVMAGPSRWAEAADLARRVEGAGFSGMVFTETAQTPWMGIAAAATAAPTLTFSTGIAVAFPVSPMIVASLAWELAANTGGRFRLGLGSQVKAHVERRYGAEFVPPGPRMRDYLLAVKDVLAAFRGDRPLRHDGPYHRLSLLPDQWRPPAHDHGDIKVDVSAVGPWMTTMAGEVADGVHVHPLHSMHYLRHRLLPAVRTGAERAGRTLDDVDLLVPVFIVPGDSPEEREPLARRARTQIGFYGSTRNYAFQFDDLGFEGTSARLNERLKAGDLDGLAATITDEMLDAYAVVGRWDEIADRIVDRYADLAARVVSYLTVEDVARNPDHLGRWAEIARAVTGATPVAAAGG